MAWTLLGIGAMDETHPLAYGYMGMHGWKHVNRAIQSADLLIAIGTLFPYTTLFRSDRKSVV